MQPDKGPDLELEVEDPYEPLPDTPHQMHYHPTRLAYHLMSLTHPHPTHLDLRHPDLTLPELTHLNPTSPSTLSLT